MRGVSPLGGIMPVAHAAVAGAEGAAALRRGEGVASAGRPTLLRCSELRRTLAEVVCFSATWLDLWSECATAAAGRESCGDLGVERGLFGTRVGDMTDAPSLSWPCWRGLRPRGLFDAGSPSGETTCSTDPLSTRGLTILSSKLCFVRSPPAEASFSTGCAGCEC